MTSLRIDIETYSEISLPDCGVYRYTSCPTFEILMVAYAVGNEQPVCYEWDDLPDEFFDLLMDDSVVKIAFNAAFERICFRAKGFDVPVEQWRCTMVKALYCGLPGSLEAVSAALGLGDGGKDAAGKALIRYFCVPCKPTKTNGMRERNLPHHAPEKWAAFKNYCAQDVVAESNVDQQIKAFRMPRSEWEGYFLDQSINDRGVLIDIEFVKNAIRIDEENTRILSIRNKELTQLSNPGSIAQLKKWIGEKTGKVPTTLDKEAVTELLETVEDDAVREALQIRQQLGKTSIKKYTRMLEYAGEDCRARGTFQYLGAGRTNRWAGRGIQLQNMPKTPSKDDMPDFELSRMIVQDGDTELSRMGYEVADVLSMLSRTALIPPKGRQFAPCDFSAIEACVLAWLAAEEWRLEVFRTHGKIYEASASKMFGIPIESITKGSDLRQKGKVAELALGYQGGVNALIKMGGDSMGLSHDEMELIKDRWRLANPAIVNLWKEFNSCAIQAVERGRTVEHAGTGIEFIGNANSTGALMLLLPSGRHIVYWGARITTNRYRQKAVSYYGINDKKQWCRQETYGGKITENVTQAVARDLLLHAMHNVDRAGFDIVAHVHDELIPEVSIRTAESDLKEIESLMTQMPRWAHDLPLRVDGFLCNFYKKD